MLFRNFLLLLMGRKRYLLDEQFNAGLTRWVVTDTEGKISVSGGNLVFSGGKAATGWTDPALVSKQFWARLAGLTIEWQITPGATNTYLAAGFTDGSLAATARELHSFEFRLGIMNIEADLASPIAMPLSYTATSLCLRIVCKATGAYYYVSTDNRITWKLIWVDSSVTTSPLYAFIESYNAALTASACRVYQGYAKPAIVSVAAAAITPALGAELASGTLTIGQWYSITATQVDYFYTGSAIGDTFLATAATTLDANNKVKQITLSSMLGGGGDAGTKFGVWDCAPATLDAGTQGGMLICADSETAPTYALWAYYNRQTGKAHLYRLENGVYTSSIANTVTYSSGAQVRVVTVNDAGTHKVALYYGGTLQGTTQSISLASYGTIIKGMATSSNNSTGTTEMNAGIGV